VVRRALATMSARLATMPPAPSNSLSRVLPSMLCTADTIRMAFTASGHNCRLVFRCIISAAVPVTMGAA
jgi:hypothetical protein